jgi:hypothetical protein
MRYAKDNNLAQGIAKTQQLLYMVCQDMTALAHGIPGYNNLVITYTSKYKADTNVQVF